VAPWGCAVIPPICSASPGEAGPGEAESEEAESEEKVVPSTLSSTISASWALARAASFLSPAAFSGCPTATSPSRTVSRHTWFTASRRGPTPLSATTTEGPRAAASSRTARGRLGPTSARYVVSTAMMVSLSVPSPRRRLRRMRWGPNHAAVAVESPALSWARSRRAFPFSSQRESSSVPASSSSSLARRYACRSTARAMSRSAGTTIRSAAPAKRKKTFTRRASPLIGTSLSGVRGAAAGRRSGRAVFTEHSASVH
jgi:hypothetical protein